jgi:transposase-like protein
MDQQNPYVKVKKVWMYLYRAVDSQGNTLEFRLSATREFLQHSPKISGMLH